jgi:cytochrome P450
MSAETTSKLGKQSHDREYSEYDISGAAFWEATAEEREKTFAKLREHDPVSWQRPIENAVEPDPEDPGYWAVVGHADISHVSQTLDEYVSGQGVLFDDLPADFLEMTQSFLAMDPPGHDHLRKIISSAFTPKQIKRIEDEIRVAAREVVDEFASDPSGEVEFVQQCASQLPLRMFSAMFGIPEHLQERSAAAARNIVAWADPEALGDRRPQEVQLEAAQELHAMAVQIVEERRKNPADDLFTSLAKADVDGEGLSDQEIGSFFVLLAVAANDTTTNASTWSVKALTDYPEQRDWLREDFDGRIDQAIEEFIRFTSPVMTFRRTAVGDTELRGRQIRQGEKVVMFYSSGNRDAEVFTDPNDLDLSRKPNKHVGFGGGGRHFCLGNQLAKSMLRALLRELLTRVPDIHTNAEPELLGTNFIRGVKRQQVAFTPES